MGVATPSTAAGGGAPAQPSDVSATSTDRRPRRRIGWSKARAGRWKSSEPVDRGGVEGLRKVEGCGAGVGERFRKKFVLLRCFVFELLGVEVWCVFGIWKWLKMGVFF